MGGGTIQAVARARGRKSCGTSKHKHWIWEVLRLMAKGGWGSLTEMLR